MWVSDSADSKIYAYNLSTKAYDSSKDFDTLDAAGNEMPDGLWSNGTTMWVLDSADSKIYAYNLRTKARDATKDINLFVGNLGDRYTGLWSNGTIIWYTDFRARSVGVSLLPR